MNIGNKCNVINMYGHSKRGGDMNEAYGIEGHASQL